MAEGLSAGEWAYRCFRAELRRPYPESSPEATWAVEQLLLESGDGELREGAFVLVPLGDTPWFREVTALLKLAKTR